LACDIKGRTQTEGAETIFEVKRDEIIGDWRKLHDEGLQNLYSSPCIIRMIKSRSIKWAGHVA
jgi:hypothetical protein